MTLPLWDDTERLKQMSIHRGASPAVRTRIETNFGVRWCEIARLSSFNPSTFSPPDSMHNILIGMTRAMMVWMTTSGSFSDTVGDRRHDWDTVFDTIIWPSHVGRIPKRVVNQMSSGGEASGLKADEWARVRTALPAVLWQSWIDPETSELAISHGHNRNGIYSAVVNFCAATRTLLSRAVSAIEVETAQDTLSRACKQLLGLGMPLTINWHPSMHYAASISRLGPAGAFSTWSFERDNGVLARTRYFRGDVQQIPVTATRRWIKEQLLYGVIHNRSPTAPPMEHRYLDQLADKILNKTMKGTLMLEEHRGTAPSLIISLPPPSSVSFDLSAVPSLYLQCFYFLRGKGLRIRHHTHLHAEGVSFWSSDHDLYTHVYFNGFR